MSITTTPTSSTNGATPIAARPDVERRLRAVLSVNAATSTCTGAALALAPGTFDQLLGTGQPGWIRLAGLGLVLFGIDVAIASRFDADRLRRVAPWIVAADVAWVVASVITVLLGWFSGSGAVAVVAVAAVVDMFAVLQFRSWRRMPRSS